MNTTDFWIWRGKEIKTLGNLMQAVQAVTTREEARAFVAEYSKVNEHATANIGYMLGYLDQSERDRLYRLFEECSHPIFGHNFGRGAAPTPEAAFEAGAARGKTAQEKRDE